MPGRLKERLRSAVELMADGAILADTTTGEVLINRAAREMLGVPEDAFVDVAYLKDTVGFYPFDLAAASPDASRCAKKFESVSGCCTRCVTPMREGDESVGAMVVLRDLGDNADFSRKRAEFAQVMAHELRTPLTSIAGALDIVLSGYAGQLAGSPAALRRHGAPGGDADESARRPVARPRTRAGGARSRSRPRRCSSIGSRAR